MLKARRPVHVEASATKLGRPAEKSRRKPAGKLRHTFEDSHFFGIFFTITHLSHEVTRGGGHCDQQLMETHYH